MAVLIAPVLLRALPPGTSTTRKVVLVGGVVFATVAADLDIPIGFAAGMNGFAAHGGASHSLLVVMIFATIFALWAKLLAPLHLGVAWLVGAMAYGSHVVLDALNHGRGVMLLWPLSTERYASPIRVFYGVRHSDLSAWSHHLVTLGTELLFVLVVLLIAFSMSHFRRRAGPLAL
jgi:hypothetical protein